jgi:hypothetical protein
MGLLYMIVWARRALNGPKRRFPARAGGAICPGCTFYQLNMTRPGAQQWYEASPGRVCH